MGGAELRGQMSQDVGRVGAHAIEDLVKRRASDPLLHVMWSEGAIVGEPEGDEACEDGLGSGDKQGETRMVMEYLRRVEQLGMFPF